MKHWDVVIIGGGASGLLAAVAANRSGASVLLLEKMEKVGRKVRITGKGRCNITNTKEWDNFAKHVYPNPSFFKKAFYSFSNKDLIYFLESIGLSTKIERGDRVYPVSDQAKDVVEKILDYLISKGVSVKTNNSVENISINDKTVLLEVESNGVKNTVTATSIVLATGGLSYPLTGSDGDGHRIAKDLGIKIKKCFPSLTALIPKLYDSNHFNGISINNVELKLMSKSSTIQVEFGDVEFTLNGLEGPLGLRVSRKAVTALNNGEKIWVEIDLKPSLTVEKLKQRAVKELKEIGRKEIISFLRGYLPSNVIQPFLAYCKITLTHITSTDEQTLIRIFECMKCWQIDIESYFSFERSIITMGGIDLSEISQKTLQLKKYPNMFVAGEIIDLDGDTGGYNLQIAFSTGYLAGENAAKYSMLTD